MELVGRAGASAVGETLQFQLHVGQHVGVEQLAQFLGAEEVSQQVAVERERGRPTLGERRVTFVHVRSDPVEEQARRHRAGRVGVDAHDPDSARAELAEHLAERRHVEHVLQALAGRLEQDRERRELRCDRQQVRGALALLPERRALVGSSAREEECPTGALAEAGGEQCGLRECGDDELVDVVRVDEERIHRQLVGRLGKPDDDAVVAPHRLDRQVELVREAPLDRHRPRCVHRSAEGAEDADPPVADLVAEPFDHDGAVVGDGTSGLGLLPEVPHEVGGGEGIECVVIHQAIDGLARDRRSQRLDGAVATVWI